MSEETFDYIVVGAGSAGCVLANRLTENSSSTVLVVEAGGSDRHLWVRVPLGVGKLLGNPEVLWQAETEPERGLLWNRISWPTGRLLGGSSSVNGMLAIRGNPAKYDEWQAAGCPGWGYEQVLPYFKRLEDCRFGDPQFRGRGGPVSITEPDDDMLGVAFLRGCKTAGFPTASDYNGAVPEGAGPFQMSTRNGLRCSTAVAYLRPALGRPNLKVLTNAIVDRVNFVESRAVGVQYRIDGETRTAQARREVLLSAGAIRSPQLLELSGIGRSDVLQKQGIPVLRHLPGVGENLQDHLMVRVCYECKEPVTVYDLLHSRLRMARELFKYAVTRKGIFATSSFPAIAFLRSNPAAPLPNIRIQLGLTSGARRLSTSDDSGLDPHSGFHLGGYPIYPQSRGSLHIRSPNVTDSPKIVASYLTREDDCIITVETLKILRRIAEQPSLARHIVREVRPGAEITGDEALLQYARQNGDTCWHPCGTCRMGRGEHAVVDPQLRVHGVEGLRVIDTSVFPFLVASNTNIPTIMLGERAADLIRGQEH
jgi:choline dehydrogenase